jgi:hypothetical protein
MGFPLAQKISAVTPTSEAIRFKKSVLSKMQKNVIMRIISQSQRIISPLEK